MAAAICAAARAVVQRGLATGTSGNISVRDGERIWITPSGVAPAAMTTDDVVPLDAAGTAPVGHRRRPSSEWQFHVAILAARPDVGAVVHTHSPWATAVSCARRDIPPFHYMMVGTGDGTLHCAPYAAPGSTALAAGVVAALGSRAACLLANHGVVATGRNLDAALAMAGEVETLAQQYAIAQALGGPQILAPTDVEELVTIFAAYGQASNRELA